MVELRGQELSLKNMGNAFEQFNFSKEEDQNKFNEPEKEKKEMAVEGVEKMEENMEEIAIDQYSQYPELIDELERQLEYLEAQTDSVRDEELAFKINSELPLLREEQEIWDELLEDDVEVLEITPILKE